MTVTVLYSTLVFSHSSADTHLHTHILTRSLVQQDAWESQEQEVTRELSGKSVEASQQIGWKSDSHGNSIVFTPPFITTSFITLGADYSIIIFYWKHTNVPQGCEARKTKKNKKSLPSLKKTRENKDKKKKSFFFLQILIKRKLTVKADEWQM